MLGVGINRRQWWKFARLLKKSIGFNFFDVDLNYISKKKLEGPGIDAESVLQPVPDAVFTSLSAFEDVSKFESFLKTYSASSSGLPTCVILIENQLSDFLGMYLSVHPLVEFNFIDYNRLTLADPIYFAKPDCNLQFPVLIEPAPLLTLTMGSDIFIDKEEKISFYLLEEVESINWENVNYEVEDFLTLQADLMSASEWIEAVTGFLQIGGSTYFSNGFCIRDLINIESPGKPIDHILSQDEINQKTQGYSSFAFKFSELMNYRSTVELSKVISDDSSNIKANIPLTVCSEHPVVNRIFYFLLKNDGYRQVTTIEEQVDQDNRFLINPTTKPEKDNHLFFNISLEPKIFAILGFSKIDQDIYANRGPVKEWKDRTEILEERNRMAKQMQKLDDQVRSLSSSKIMADQEKYINLLASRKQEIITALLEISYIWDESTEDPLISGNEDLLIFYDDQLQATTLNNLLPGRGKKLYVDVLNQTYDLKALITLNTDILEPFLHKGIVICCSSSKTILTGKLKQFKNELANYKGPDLSDAINKLNSEKNRCQKRLLGLAYEEAYYELKIFYGKLSDRIFDAAKIAYDEISKNIFQPERLHRICICSMNKERCEIIETALKKCLPKTEDAQIQLVMAHPGLNTTLNDVETIPDDPSSYNQSEGQPTISEEIISQNVEKMKIYFDTLISQFSNLSSDLLIIEQDLKLLKLFIPILRQEENSFRNTPIVALFSGDINKADMEFLSHIGVKLVYRDQFKAMNFESLVEPLGRVLSFPAEKTESVEIADQIE